MTIKQKNHARMIFDVELDDNHIPINISWNADSNKEDEWKNASALIVNLWDTSQKSSLKLDLWSKDLPVNEMTQFFYQSLMSLSETFERATGNDFIVGLMKTYCNDISEKIALSNEK